MKPKSDCCGAKAIQTNIGLQSPESKSLYKCSRCGEVGAIYGTGKCDHEWVILENDNGAKVRVCKWCEERSL